MPGEDLELIRRIASGDRCAVGELYARYAGLLYAVGKRMLGSKRETEDLVHDVFVEAWQHAPEYDPARATVRTWLLVRLRSRALDRRTHASRTQLGAGFGSVADVAQRADPGLAERVALREALERLDPDVLTVLELTYFEGRPAREIAGLTGIPEGTVRSRLARGVRALHAILKGESDDAH